MALRDFERFAHLLTKGNLRRNPALRNRLKDAILKGNEKSIINIGKETGYDFTADDIWAYRKKYITAVELTDEDLMNVAGKVGPYSDVLALQAAAVVAYAVAVNTAGLIAAN